jgi:alpha-N-arabinofuranosidase
LIAAGLAVVVAAPQDRGTEPAPISVTVDSANTRARIDRNLFGQFAEHLGNGIYEGDRRHFLCSLGRAGAMLWIARLEP